MKREISLIEELLLALIPYTKANLELSTNPNKFFDKLAEKRSVSKNAVAVAITRAKKDGLIRKLESDFQLTDKGKVKILKNFKKRGEKWDGKWRLIFFDIPEKERYKRTIFRSKLKELGFKQHQLSAWISPYDYSEEIDVLINELDIEKYVKYLIGDTIIGSEELKKAFDL